MKTKIALLIAGFFALFVSFAVAQTPAPTAPVAFGVSADTLVTWLTPILVPLLIAGIKKVSPSIPSYVLPLIAPVLGIALDYINTLATSHPSNFAIAAVLGLAGVGVREVKDQLTPAPAANLPPN